MTRVDYLLHLYDWETLRHYYYSVSGKPMKGREKECQEIEERLEIIEQMLNELQSDNLVDGEETGIAKQEFIGTISGEAELYYNVRNTCKNYYVNLIVKDVNADEGFQDLRLLRLSYKTWLDWFANGHYQEEQQKRMENNSSTLVKLFMLNSEVVELEWFDSSI